MSVSVKSKKPMGHITVLYMVKVKQGEKGKEKIYGGYASSASARAAARAYISALKKAYDPLIATSEIYVAKDGTEKRRRAKLKTESKLYLMDDATNPGGGKFSFAPKSESKAMQYLEEKMDVKRPIVLVEAIKNTTKNKGFWKVFNSTGSGKLIANPKRR